MMNRLPWPADGGTVRRRRRGKKRRLNLQDCVCPPTLLDQIVRIRAIDPCRKQNHPTDAADQADPVYPSGFAPFRHHFPDLHAPGRKVEHTLALLAGVASRPSSASPAAAVESIAIRPRDSANGGVHRTAAGRYRKVGTPHSAAPVNCVARAAALSKPMGRRGRSSGHPPL